VAKCTDTLTGTDASVELSAGAVIEIRFCGGGGGVGGVGGLGPELLPHPSSKTLRQTRKNTERFMIFPYSIDIACLQKRRSATDRRGDVDRIYDGAGEPDTRVSVPMNSLDSRRIGTSSQSGRQRPLNLRSAGARKTCSSR